jgi:hypothetical protein
MPVTALRPPVTTARPTTLPVALPGPRTLVVGSVTARVNPASQTPGDIMQSLRSAGVDVTLDRYGRLVFGSASSVSGDADLLVALGLA